MKSEKGAITLYVTIACLFVLIIGVTNYIITSNKQTTQLKMINEIERLNNIDVNDEDIINSYVGGDIVPIDSLENFKKIGTDEQVYINGQFYTFGTDKTYVLQNDLVYDGDYTQMITRIKNNNIVVTGGDYEIAVTTNNVTDYYVSRWNYCVPKGKVYGSLYKISDDEYHLIFNASGNLAKGYTQEQLIGTSPDISGGSTAQESNSVWKSTQLWGTYSDEITKCKIEEEINPTSTAYYFCGLFEITEIEGISNLKTDQSTDMSGMFYNCYKLKSIDLSQFNTSKVRNMARLFHNCLALTELDVSSFDTSNVTNMSGMFAGDSTRLASGIDFRMNLTTINGLTSFDTSNVLDMSWMFYMCLKLTSINLSSFNTSKVTNMHGMFAGAWTDAAYFMELTEIIGLGNFDTSESRSMGMMFYGCHKLTSINVSSFNTSKVTNMYGMFVACKSLTELDLSNFDTGIVTTMEVMFDACTNLTKLDISSFNTSIVTKMRGMFYNCPKLETIYVGNGWTINAVTDDTSNMFTSCTKLVGAVPYSSSNANDKTYANWATGYLTYKAKNLNEYQNLSYIASSGTQYIDTGINGNNDNLSFEIQYQWIEFPSMYASVFGGFYSDSYNHTRIVQKGTDSTLFSVNSQTGSYGGTRDTNTIYTDKLSSQNNVVTYETNGTQRTMNKGTLADIDINICVFSRTNGIGNTKIKLYYFKIWDNGTLIRDFVPCKVKADNSVGLYDAVTGIFYANRGTGTFAEPTV